MYAIMKALVPQSMWPGASVLVDFIGRCMQLFAGPPPHLYLW